MVWKSDIPYEQATQVINQAFDQADLPDWARVQWSGAYQQVFFRQEGCACRIELRLGWIPGGKARLTKTKGWICRPHAKDDERARTSFFERLVPIIQAAGFTRG